MKKNIIVMLITTAVIENQSLAIDFTNDEGLYGRVASSYTAHFADRSGLVQELRKQSNIDPLAVAVLVEQKMADYSTNLPGPVKKGFLLSGAATEDKILDGVLANYPDELAELKADIAKERKETA